MAVDNEMILNLMQNVCDELEKISENNKLIKDKIFEETIVEALPESNLEIDSKILEIKNRQEKLAILMSKTKLSIETIVKASRPLIKNTQTNEYYLLGKHAQISAKLLILITSTVLMAFLAFKYIPPYITENSAITTERDNYKLFYDYVFLSAYKTGNNSPDNVSDVLERIIKREPSLMKDIKSFRDTYSAQIQKEELLRQIEKLENSNRK